MTTNDRNQDVDGLARVLAEHGLDRARSSVLGSYCHCGQELTMHNHAAHVAPVVLAHLTAEGWAKGRGVWDAGYAAAILDIGNEFEPLTENPWPYREVAE